MRVKHALFQLSYDPDALKILTGRFALSTKLSTAGFRQIRTARIYFNHKEIATPEKHDPPRVKQALFQLSYDPVKF